MHVHLFQICDAVMASGQTQSQRNKIQEQSPLMYEWYQEEYVGAAHGLSGIYYYLMQVSTLAIQLATTNCWGGKNYNFGHSNKLIVSLSLFSLGLLQRTGFRI